MCRRGGHAILSRRAEEPEPAHLAWAQPLHSAGLWTLALHFEVHQLLREVAATAPGTAPRLGVSSPPCFVSREQAPSQKTPSRLLADWLRLPSGHPSGDVCTQDRRDPRRRCAHPPAQHRSGRKLWVPKRIALASAGPVRAAHTPHAEAMSTRTLDAPVRTAQRVTSRVSPAGACAGDRDGWGLPGRRRVDQPRAEAGGQ